MKLELETIPVWDGVKSDKECFLCSLMKEAEAHAVSYFLGSSVMHPETRLAVNDTGFCPNHWALLAAAGKPQSLALISHTYLEQTLGQLEPRIERIAKGKAGRKTTLAVQDMVVTMQKREAGCLVCDKMKVRLDRYATTIVYLWGEDVEFRQALSEGKGVCLHHLEALLTRAPSVLDAKQTQAFSTELTTLVHHNLKRLEHDLWWMTQKYKAEHVDSPWNGCEDAHKRLVNKLIGEGRIFSDS
ncbi:MAG: DUF6062 family protein [Sphaerochaeta sp.]|nr:DUF6062 family protein [Sphaerochaeta sp.]